MVFILEDVFQVNDAVKKPRFQHRQLLHFVVHKYSASAEHVLDLVFKRGVQNLVICFVQPVGIVHDDYKGDKGLRWWWAQAFADDLSCCWISPLRFRRWSLVPLSKP